MTIAEIFRIDESLETLVFSFEVLSKGDFNRGALILVILVF